MMNTGSNCRSSRKRSNALGADRLRRLFAGVAVFCCCVALSACGETPREQPPSVRPSPPTLTITPAQVRIGDLAFYQTRSAVIAKHPRFSCRINDMGEQVCSWTLTGAERRRGYEGISRVTLKFVDERLHEIGVGYTEMFDVEYTPFAAKVSSRWGSGAAAADSSSIRWGNDSLAITLLPKRKLHWTRTAYTFTPVITYQERMLRR